MLLLFVQRRRNEDCTIFLARISVSNFWIIATSYFAEPHLDLLEGDIIVKNAPKGTFGERRENETRVQNNPRKPLAFQNTFLGHVGRTWLVFL